MKLKVTNPANHNLIEEIQCDTEASIIEKFELAKKAQKDWSKVPFLQKHAMIEKFKDLLLANKEKLGNVLTSETGKPISQSVGEIKAMKGRIEFFLKNTEKCLQEQYVHQQDGMIEKITYEPLGVVGNISAWNYPYFVGSNVFIPALLTGNTVLYKPSEYALLTGLEITKLFYEVGIPKDVFQTVIGAGEAGAQLSGLPLDGLFFTGSYLTGKKIAQSSHQQLLKLQLELGGKDPAYVCEDADLQATAENLADGAFYNAGQSCCSIERIYVHEKIYDDFLEQFTKCVKNFKTGDPTSSDTYLGPLTRVQQIGVLENQVKDALSKGAKILLGGHATEGTSNYFEPTILIEVNHDMLLMKEESFGPIIGIQKVKSDDEAVSLMNDTEYGLTSGVFTQDQVRAENILTQLDSGSVFWNCCDRVSPRLPWTGRKHSGLGSTLSKIGIHSFLQPKAWHLKS